jgi:hypothetical protein
MNSAKSPLDDYESDGEDADALKAREKELLDDDEKEEEAMDTSGGGDKGNGGAKAMPPPPPPPPPPSGSGVRQRSDSVPSTSSDGGSRLPRAYYNIRAAKLSGMPVRTAKNYAGKTWESVSSFQVNDDHYNATANYRHNYNAKQNISASFDLNNLKCNSCKGGGTVSSAGMGRGSRPESWPQSPSYSLTRTSLPPSL